MKEHYLYKYVYNNQIIYIGKTNNSLQQRIYAHANESKFQPYVKESKIYIMELANSTEVNALEMLLINKYQPLLNYADKHDKTTNIKFEELTWNTYQSYLDNHCNDVIDRRYIQTQITRCVSTMSKLNNQLLSLEKDLRTELEGKTFASDLILNPMFIKTNDDNKIKSLEHRIKKLKEDMNKWYIKYKYYKSKENMYE